MVSACGTDENTTDTEANAEPTNSITEGFVLYSYIGDTISHLIDSLGVEVKAWESSYTSSGSCYLSENKTLLRLGKLPKVNNGAFSSGGLVAGIIEELDDNNTTIWSIQRADDDATFHHDFKEVDKNTIIALAWQLRVYNNSNYWNEVVIMIDKTDNSVFWEWNAMDDGGLFPEDTDQKDYLHFNSVDYKNGEILISSKNKNALYIIDQVSKTITASITVGGTLSGQHDATFLDNGNLLVFNNKATPNRSAVLEVTASDEQIWAYSNQFYSDHISGVQRLDSGHTLICSGEEPRFIEINDSGDEVWDFTPEPVTSNRSSEIFKVNKYTSY